MLYIFIIIYLLICVIHLAIMYAMDEGDMIFIDHIQVYAISLFWPVFWIYAIIKSLINKIIDKWKLKRKR